MHLDLLNEAGIWAYAVTPLLNQVHTFLGGDVVVLHHIHDDKSRRQTDTT
jgi:hypothetical protein